MSTAESNARTWGQRPRSSPGAPLREILSRSEETDLVGRCQRGDRRAMERLIETHIRLVYREANRYRARTHHTDDLVQEGIVGLIHAVELFDPHLGCRLSTYAAFWIRQAIGRAVLQNDRLIRLPIHAGVKLRRLLRLHDEQYCRLGRPPHISDLARASGLTEERVEELLALRQDAASLDTLLAGDPSSSLLESLADRDLRDPEEDALDCLGRQHLRALLTQLDGRERRVIEKRYGFDDGPPHTLDELGKQMRVSSERIRQIEARALRKLRRALNGPLEQERCGDP